MSSQTARLIAIPGRPQATASKTNVVLSPGSYVVTGVDQQTFQVREPAMARSKVVEAQEEIKAQRPGQAASILEEMLDRWPGYVPAMLLLACVKHSSGDGKEARRLYHAIREIQPECWQASYNEALLCVAEGNLAGGIQLFRDACALAPSEPEPMFRLALALEEDERPREALIWYVRAAELREKFPAAWLRAAVLMMRSGSWQEAAQALERCLDSEEDGASMWYHYAICLLELGHVDRAKTALEESHKRCSENAPVLQTLALLTVLEGSLELAARYEQAAEECGEASAAILYRLALALQERGNDELARQYYRRALDVEPSLALNYFN